VRHLRVARPVYVCLCVGADVNAADRDGDTCLHMILRLIARGEAGKHPLVDVFNTVDIPLVGTIDTLCSLSPCSLATTGSPLVTGVEDTVDSKPKDGRRWSINRNPTWLAIEQA